jgi:hypothetical protein
MELALVLVFVAILCAVSFKIGRNKANIEVEISNEQIIKDREQILKDKEEIKNEITNLQDEYYLKRLNYDKEYKNKIDNLESQYKLKNELLEEQYQSTIEELDLNILTQKKELDSLKDTNAAACELFHRDAANISDDCRLTVSIDDKHDIDILNNMKKQMYNPRILSMLVWQTFYQKQATAKFNELLGTEQVCGIYKIENIKDHKIYIGQAVDIKKRWNNHAKACLGIDAPKGNKLYSAAQEEGLDNFTFEVVEKCAPEDLNWKEAYYIDAYKSDTFGYNSQGGNKK